MADLKSFVFVVNGYIYWWLGNFFTHSGLMLFLNIVLPSKLRMPAKFQDNWIVESGLNLSCQIWTIQTNKQINQNTNKHTKQTEDRKWIKSFKKQCFLIPKRAFSFYLVILNFQPWASIFPFPERINPFYIFSLLHFQFLVSWALIVFYNLSIAETHGITMINVLPSAITYIINQGYCHSRLIVA